MAPLPVNDSFAVSSGDKTPVIGKVDTVKKDLVIYLAGNLWLRYSNLPTPSGFSSKRGFSYPELLNRIAF